MWGQVPATVADVAAIAAPDQAGDDFMMKVEEMMEKLKTKNLSLHDELVAEKTAHAHALMGNVSLQPDMKKAVAERKRDSAALGWGKG